MATKDQRRQGVACDACKFRKVRCDRREKLERKAPYEDENQIACTICAQHGLRCTFTQSAPRRRRGKRIVAIQKSQLEDIDDSLAQRSLEAEQTAGSSRAGEPRDHQGAIPMGLPESLPNPFLFGNEDQSKEVEDLSNARRLADEVRARAKEKPMPTDHQRAAQIKQGLFGIRGLTRALLDACVRAYFKYANPCMPILPVEVFSERYSLFFALFDENNGVIPDRATLKMNVDDMPLSLLLILGVGCVGAALLEPPIAEPGAQAKFRLQDRIALRFQEVLQEKDILSRLKDEGADVLEACYIMSDPTLTVLGDDQRDREIDFEHLLNAPASQREKLDPLRMSPSTSEAVIRLIFAMGLNKRPKPRLDCAPDDPCKWSSGGVPITQREVFRRVRIFWSAFMQDSFRSMGRRKKTLINSDDYDLDLPRIIPRKDGFFTAMLFYTDADKAASTSASSGPVKDHVPDNPDPGPDPQVYLQPARFSRFDALQLEVILRLAFIIRTVSIRFVSPRAQGRGVLITDVERATASLTAWKTQLPADVTWKVQAAPLLQMIKQGKAGINDAVALRNSIKSLFVEMLYHGNVLAVWASVSDYGVRFEVDLSEAIHLFHTRMGLDNNSEFRANEVSRTGMISMLGRQDEEYEREVRKRKALDGMDRLAAKSFKEVARLCREAGKAGLMRANRTVLLNISSSYAVWGCDLGRRIDQSDTHFGFEASAGQDPASAVFSCVDDLLFAMSTIDSFEKAPDVVKQIGGLLQKSRASVAMNAETNPFSSTTGRAAPSQKDSFSPFAASSQTSDESNSQGANSAEQPFHYFYRKGERLDLGDTARDIGRPPPISSMTSATSFTSPNNSDTSSMDSDVVVQLARAALPKAHRQVPISVSGQTSSGPGFADLNFESITDVDTQWLSDFLSGEKERNGNGYVPRTERAAGFDQASAPPPPSSTAAYAPWQSGARAPEANENQYATQMFGVPAIDWGIDSKLTDVPPPVEQATTQAAGLDVQWDQMMADANDAQLWAETQWQGFHFAPPVEMQ